MIGYPGAVGHKFESCILIARLGLAQLVEQ
jgi:hypothetical protein